MEALHNDSVITIYMVVRYKLGLDFMATHLVWHLIKLNKYKIKKKKTPTQATDMVSDSVLTIIKMTSVR